MPCSYLAPARPYYTHPHPATESDEPALLRLAKLFPRTAAGGDAAARVLARHRGLTLRACQNVLHAGFELDDLLQQASLVGLDAIRCFDPTRGYQFNTYLMDCVRRALWTWIHKRRNQPPAQEGDDDGEQMREVPEGERGAAQEVRDRIEDALSELDPKSAQVVRLRHGIGEADGKPVHWTRIPARTGLRMKAAQRMYREAVAYIRDEFPDLGAAV